MRAPFGGPDRRAHPPRRVYAPARGLVFGAFSWWLALSLATAIWLPSASYLFVWPTLGGLLGLAISSLLPARASTASAAAFLGSIPSLILLAPLIRTTFDGLSLPMAQPVMVLVVLFIGALMPLWGPIFAMEPNLCDSENGDDRQHFNPKPSTLPSQCRIPFLMGRASVHACRTRSANRRQFTAPIPFDRPGSGCGFLWAASSQRSSRRSVFANQTLLSWRQPPSAFSGTSSATRDPVRSVKNAALDSTRHNDENERPSCPHCGEPQAAVRQSSMRRGFVVLLIAVMTAVCILATITFALDPLRDIRPFERSRLAALSIAAASAVLATLATAWLLASGPRSIQPGVRICEGCGEIIPEKPPAPSICPNCRSRKLTHNELKEEQAEEQSLHRLEPVGAGDLRDRRHRLLLPRHQARHRTGLARARSGTALVILFLAWKLIPFLMNSRRLNDVLGEEAALAKARACAGEDGSVVRVGPTTIWFSGPDDPVPILQDEILASHRRLEHLLGETAIADPPLTILCFHEQAALLKLYKSLFPSLDLTAHLGVYLQRPWNIMALCTGTVAGRLDDARSSFGSLYCLVLLEQSVGQLSAPWLQAGLTASLSADHNRGDLCGLNRRMLAALRGQLAWSENLFTASAIQVGKLSLRTKRSPQRQKI